MIVQCSRCGNVIVVNGLGRKRLNIPVKNVYDALTKYANITMAAESLGCSRGYIYKILAENKRK